MPVFVFAEVTVFVALEKAVKMSERRKRRDEFDKMLVAEVVEFGHFLCREALVGCNDAVKLAESESVFNIKLKFVNLEI
jgi:hypothetical protein